MNDLRFAFRNVMGRAIEIDGEPATIIGVMPERFGFPSESSGLWQLQPPEQPAPRGAGPWFVLGRLIGAGLGVVLAFSITRMMQRLLFEVRPTDALTFAAVALLLGSVALFACWLPARRAANVNPTVPLRRE